MLPSTPQLLYVPQKIPAAAAGGGLVYAATDAQLTVFGFATSGSFSGVNFGAASSDRIVMIGVQSDGANLSTLAMTIGGVSATLAVADTVNHISSIWYANVPSGTTGTVAWTNTAAVNPLGIVVSQIHGQSGGGAATPTTNSFTTAMAQPIGPLSVIVTAGGVAFVTAGAQNGAGSTPTYTWTNTTAANGDETISTASGNLMEIGSAHMTASGGVTVSSTSTLAFALSSILSAAWAP